MARTYELMLVLRSDVDVSEKNVTDVVTKMIGDKAKIVSVSVVGKKTFAYPIKKQKEGIVRFVDNHRLRVCTGY